jgi:catechol 2,3-dioxygenase-like lactoylglutathione lyase family enzyme
VSEKPNTTTEEPAMPTKTSIVTGVDFVTVPTKDYDAAAKFYGGVLGLPFGKRWGDMPAGKFETGNLTIAVWEPKAFGQEFQTHKSPPPPLRAKGTEARLGSKGIRNAQ